MRKNESLDPGKIKFTTFAEEREATHINDIILLMKQRQVQEVTLTDEQGFTIGVMKASAFLQLLDQDEENLLGKVEH